MTNQLIPDSDLLREATRIFATDPSLTSADVVLRLRRSFPDLPVEVVGLAAETATGRASAQSKLGSWAATGLFSKALLEQASRKQIASYRSRYFRGIKHALEIGTGTASDTAELARVCQHVTTIEADPQRCEAARHNLAIQGLSNVTLIGDDAQRAISHLDLTQFDALFADPARRSRDGTRVRDSDDYSPSLSWLLEIPITGVRAIKISPGLFIDPPQGWVRQFVGYESECLEQTLWYGAGLVDSSIHLADLDLSWAPLPNASSASLPSSLTGHLIEAHGAINRSQYLSSFFEERGISLVAPETAYGVCITRPEPSPLLTSFAILEALPFNQKILQERLRTLGWTSRTEFKKRNHAVDLDQLRKALHLPPHAHNAPFGTVFFFPWRGKRWMALTKRESE